MALPTNVRDREFDKFKESGAAAGETAVKVVNPDGSNLGAGSATIANGQVTVDTTSGGVQVVAARAGRRSVTIVNLGATDVYVGAGTVTTSNGFLLPGTKGAALTIETAAQVKAIVASGSQAVAYLEEYD